jgi:UDP-N-acetylglucosamine:LPS N-acetylglucosamine transferase
LKPEYATGYREVRLYDLARLDVMYSIDMNVDGPLATHSRSNRLVVHGGGWGIGTFEQRIPDIEKAGYELDVVCYARSEAAANSNGRRYVMDDPSWRTWYRNDAGDLTFPPFGAIDSSGEVAFTPQTECHGLHRLIRSAQAIVSKPGAGTLIDSFGAATPIIMLEAFGPHEERNAEVWSARGFGIPYREWVNAGCRSSSLHELQRNLVARRSEVKDYAGDYAATVLASN